MTTTNVICILNVLLYISSLSTSIPNILSILENFGEVPEHEVSEILFNIFK